MRNRRRPKVHRSCFPSFPWLLHIHRPAAFFVDDVRQLQQLAPLDDGMMLAIEEATEQQRQWIAAIDEWERAIRLLLLLRQRMVLAIVPVVWMRSGN